MANLLEETLEVLQEHSIKEEDILRCGYRDGGWFSWDNFKELANIEYDDGYGSVEIPSDLVVVGKDFWLERAQYDGSEWWGFKQAPTKGEPLTVNSFSTI
jgi:hypothetical protein